MKSCTRIMGDCADHVRVALACRTRRIEVVLLSISILSCTSTAPYHLYPILAPVHPDDSRALGPEVSAEVCGGSILFLIPVGDDLTFHELVSRATSKAGASNLAAITVDWRITNYLYLYRAECMVLHGREVMPARKISETESLAPPSETAPVPAVAPARKPDAEREPAGAADPAALRELLRDAGVCAEVCVRYFTVKGEKTPTPGDIRSCTAKCKRAGQAFAACVQSARTAKDLEMCEAL